MITKEWCKEYALINQGLNADNVFPVAWHNSALSNFYPHQSVGDDSFFTESATYCSWGTLVTLPVQTLPTVNVTNCNTSVRRAALDMGYSLTSIPIDSFKVFNFLSNTSATDAWFFPAGAEMNGSLSFSFWGNFERVAQIVNNVNRKSTAYVFPYVLAGLLAVSGTVQTDVITLSNNFVNPISTLPLSTAKYGQNRFFSLTETLDYVPTVFDSHKISFSSFKSLSFVGYAIQKQESSFQNIRTALFIVPVLP